MTELKLYNTLTLQKETFVAQEAPEVGLYTCGPTVYNYAHIGNLRTYIFEDILKRCLIYNNFQVKHVMNITDVGHLTGDMDMGEDKLELGAKREGKSAWDIAAYYTESFKNDLVALNIMEPSIWCKATDYINEQIYLISELEAKGYTYQISDGVYFDTSKIKDYNKLSHLPLEDLKEGARVEKNEEKRNATDFALWKFSNPKRPYSKGSFDAPSTSSGQAAQDNVVKRRQMEWDSPWGVGFPGWHIECSAMSLKFLSGMLDIHCGGIDHINVHHTNEIAQSESATGNKFFNYWMHGAFLNITGGKKMAKSEGNFLTVQNALIEKGIDPLAYRFACLQTHYRKTMEYSEEAIMAAENGLKHLRNQITQHATPKLPTGQAGTQQGVVDNEFRDKFLAAINDDLNTAQALALIPEIFKSDLSTEDKLATIFDFDRVLGLKLDQASHLEVLPEAIEELVSQRRDARVNKDWASADELRKQIEELGYLVEDAKDGMRITKK